MATARAAPQTLPSLQLLRRLRVSGGSVAVGVKLAEEEGHDGKRIVAVPVLTVDNTGRIRTSTWTVLGGLATMDCAASSIWKDAEDDIHVVFRFPDLSVFQFLAESNVSAWLERQAVDVRFINKSTKRRLDFEEAALRGVGELIIRAHIVPGSMKEASLWISVYPTSKAELVAKLVPQRNLNVLAIPHLSLRAKEADELGLRTFSRGKSVTATLEKQEEDDLGLGMGVLAYLDTAMGGPDGPLPDPRRYKETVLAHLRISSMGVPTTTANLDSLMEKFLDGSAPAVQQGPAVFPQFTAQDRPEGR